MTSIDDLLAYLLIAMSARWRLVIGFVNTCNVSYLGRRFYNTQVK